MGLQGVVPMGFGATFTCWGNPPSRPHLVGWWRSRSRWSSRWWHSCIRRSGTTSSWSLGWSSLTGTPRSYRLQWRGGRMHQPVCQNEGSITRASRTGTRESWSEPRRFDRTGTRNTGTSFAVGTSNRECGTCPAASKDQYAIPPSWHESQNAPSRSYRAISSSPYRSRTHSRSWACCHRSRPSSTSVPYFPSYGAPSNPLSPTRM